MNIFDRLFGKKKPAATQQPQRDRTAPITSDLGEVTTLEEGDIFYDFNDGKCFMHKMIKDDPEHGLYHILSYEPWGNRPRQDELHKLKVQHPHFPIVKTSVMGARLLAHTRVTDEDLAGYRQFIISIQDEAEIEKWANHYWSTGVALATSQQQAAAVQQFSYVVELMPTNNKAIRARGNCYRELRRYEEAIADFRIASTLDPMDSLAVLSLGLCYISMQQPALAIPHLEKAIELNPSDHMATMQLMIAKKMAGVD